MAMHPQARFGRASQAGRWLLAAAVSAALLAAAGIQARADMLLAPGNFGLRSDLRLLDDAGVLNLPLDTWPIPWSAIADQLSGVNPARLPPAQAAAVNAVLRQAPKGMRRQVTFATRTPQVGLRWFNDTPRGRDSIAASAEKSGPLLSWKLSVQAVHDAPDGHAARLDGSYLGVNLGNWMLSAGAVDRWWGPAWGGSMLLSSNARPVPGISLQRRRADAFATPWLHWLGPWRLVAFVGQLQAHRSVPRARLVGARVAVHPLQGLTLGVSRVGQWGGQHQGGWTSFRSALVGESEPAAPRAGVGLTGVDVRWAFHAGPVPLALYGERVHQGRAAAQPAATFGQYGIASWGTLDQQGDTWRLFAEYADTAGGFTGTRTVYNAVYDNPVYRSGYRYYQRPIGYPAGNDARLETFGYIATVPGSGDLAIIARHGHLNRDNGGYNPVAPVATRYNSFRIDWYADLDRAQLGLGFGYDWVHPRGGHSARHGVLYLSWTSDF